MQQDLSEIRKILTMAKQLDLPIVVVFKNGDRKSGSSVGIGGHTNWTLYLEGKYRQHELADIQEVFVKDDDDS